MRDKEKEIVRFYSGMIKVWTPDQIEDYCKLHQMPPKEEDAIKYHLLQNFVTRNADLFNDEDIRLLTGFVVSTKERLEQEKIREGSKQK